MSEKRKIHPLDRNASETGSSDRNSRPAKYSALRIIATLNKIGAIILAILGIISLFDNTGRPIGTGVVVAIIPVFVSALILYASGEIIYVFLDTEENVRKNVEQTHQTNKLLRALLEEMRNRNR
jgi:hypothetical protein